MDKLVPILYSWTTAFIIGGLWLALIVWVVYERVLKSRKKRLEVRQKKLFAVLASLLVGITAIVIPGIINGAAQIGYFSDIALTEDEIMLFEVRTFYYEDSPGQSTVPCLYLRTLDRQTRERAYKVTLGDNHYVMHFGDDILIGKNSYELSSLRQTGILYLVPESGELRLLAEEGKPLPGIGNGNPVAKVKLNFATLENGDIYRIDPATHRMEAVTEMRNPGKKSSYGFRRGSNANKSVLQYEGEKLPDEFLFPKIVEERDDYATILSFEDISKTKKKISVYKAGELAFEKRLADLEADAGVEAKSFQRTYMQEGEMFFTLGNVLLSYTLPGGELRWKKEVAY